MKNDGMGFVDWLHKIRREAAADRKRRGISGVEWLGETRLKAESVLKHFRRSRTAMVKRPTKQRHSRTTTVAPAPVRD